MLLARIMRWQFSRLFSDDFRKVYAMLGNNRQENFEVLEKMASLYNPLVHSQFLNTERKERLRNEIEKYREGRGRKDKIATIAWTIIRLGLFDQYRDLMNHFAERIEHDEWYVNFDEAVRAMEAFHWLKDDDQRNSLYEKVERNVNKTIWEVNMTYYERLSRALVQAKRLQSPLWDKLEYHILNNLSMIYSPKTILDTFLNFAIAGKGSKEFYHALQLTIYQGHLFERPYFLQGQVQHAYSSELLATLFRVFGLAVNGLGMSPTPEFSQYLLKIMSHSQFQLYELGHVTTIIQNLQYFEYGEELDRQAQTLLLRKIKTIEGFLRLEDVIEFYERMAYHKVPVPETIVQELSQLVIRTIVNGPRRFRQSLDVYSYLLRNNLTGTKDFEQRVDLWLENGWRYLNGQEILVLTSTMAQLDKKLLFGVEGPKIVERSATQPLLPS